VNTNSAAEFGNKVQSCGTEDAKISYCYIIISRASAAVAASSSASWSTFSRLQIFSLDTCRQCGSWSVARYGLCLLHPTKGSTERRKFRQHKRTVMRQWTDNFINFFHGEVPLFWRYPNFLTIQSRMGGRNSPCQNQLNPLIRFDTIPTCERHRATASTAL